MSITPSRTPGLRKTSPSRLAVSSGLRPAPSLSNLHIHSHSLEPLALPSVPLSSQALDSSASSVFTVDINEGILLQSEDTETEEAEEVTVLSRDSDVASIDEGSKRVLRDQLRRTLSRKASGAGGVSCPTYSYRMSYESAKTLPLFVLMPKASYRTFLT